MTRREAVEMLRTRAEDAVWEAEEVDACFRALYGRQPAGDEDADPLSLCYAAL